MPSLKQNIGRFSRAVGFAAVLNLLFSFLLALATALNRLLSWSYARACGLLGILHYDQRFNAIRGVSAWRWAERGYFLYMNVKPGDVILDLCSGDGLYPGEFLHHLDVTVDGVDFDPKSIRQAGARYPSPRISFHALDVLRQTFPRSRYSIVSCFASLQYFSPADLQALLAKIAAALREDQSGGGSGGGASSSAASPSFPRPARPILSPSTTSRANPPSVPFWSRTSSTSTSGTPPGPPASPIVISSPSPQNSSSRSSPRHFTSFSATPSHCKHA